MITSLLSCKNSVSIDKNTIIPSVSTDIYGTNILIKNASFPRVFGSNLPSGHNDLYGVPMGKKAIVFTRMESCNTTTVSITCNPEIKKSGVYYKIGPNNVTAGLNYNSTASFIGTPLVLNYGDTIGINITFNSGLNFWYNIMEFDSTTHLASSMILSLSNGNNTLYTVPVGSTAIIVGNPGNPAGYGSQGFCGVFNNSGSPSYYSTYLVPNGGSANNSNVLAYSSGPYGPGGFYAAFVPTMNGGDFLVVNTNNPNSNQLAWVTYYELP